MWGDMGRIKEECGGSGGFQDGRGAVGRLGEAALWDITCLSLPTCSTCPPQPEAPPSPFPAEVGPQGTPKLILGLPRSPARVG